ncbi:3-deoxy-7-phosphoheptulonate synthase [Methylacidimicrobium sp. B4]|uniref:3-deoxy-7-phosphoheptulonate synthase n=1 Tax=Methylacidimicrobium sp. B4 TaxID=2796139 RepID=UPI001A8DB58B|nr:3-deoxy-7-phosphoheptulonate synthase [Methylacidimicrobium sp. B4]QSR85786.1 3-deoxy-7-phosphoheptulonate synthase [Methylacidimicrobium sp. B4]
MLPIQDLRVRSVERLVSPRALKESLPLTEAANQTVYQSRSTLQRIFSGEDQRFLVIVGPCSIHDPVSALEYAQRLRLLQEDLQGEIFLVMRAYFEKPRTTLGWKGLINDPFLDGSCNIQEGVRLARQLLLQINEMGLPTASEFLDAITPQYIDDLVSWAAIGARTTESQLHREMASGLSMPVGFKNGTDGSLQIAVDALGAALQPHSFVGIDQEGFTSVIRTSGNPWGHVVLRGGHKRSNYDPESIQEACIRLLKAGLPQRVVVDCSHANSAKRPAVQETVLASILDQRLRGTAAIIGAMLESSLYEGSQKIPEDLAQLRYGISVTDPCMGWEATEKVLRQSSRRIQEAFSAGA